MVHVGDAPGVSDLGPHLVTAYVGLGADVQGGPLPRGELAPRVEDLAGHVQHRLVVVNADLTAANAVGNRQGHGLAGFERVCDGWCCRGDHGRRVRRRMSQDQDDGHIGLVGELECARALLANSNVAAGEVRVDALVSHLDL